jgi:OmpR family two-component system bacitracin resistance response regulator BceR
MRIFSSEQPHLVMIDIQLPQYDGFHWCREIRNVSKVPIIFLSSRDHPMDMIMAMNIGADDYVQKPFNMEVLLAKIKSLLRRVYSYEEAAIDILEWNQAVIDLKSGEIKKDDLTLNLTRNECFILSVLVNASNTIVSRQQLMKLLWDDDQYINDNTLTANVKRVREKLEPLGLSNALLTKKGQGYMAVTL